MNWNNFTKAALKHLLNDYHRQSSAYLIIQPSLLWLSIVESAANGEYYFVSLLKLAIFRDQGHIREVVAVRDASQRNLSTITIPPPRQAFMLSTKFSPDHLLVHILVHQSGPLNLAPVSSSSSHLLSSSLGPCGARQVNARACLERSSFNVLRFFDTVLLKMYQFSSYRWWSLLALFHKKLGMGEEGGLTISSVTTDQGYIREVTAVSEPLQSLPPITFTSLSSVTHPQSFPPKTQTTSLSTKSFTNLNPPLLIVTGVVLLLSFLVIHLGPYGARQVNARAG